MTHRRSIGTILPSCPWNGNKGSTSENVNHGDIEKKGYLVKQKNMKSLFFVLRRETTDDRPARLEYYTSEKKFIAGLSPKKTYILKHCFNISRKLGKKNNVIALYINKSCVGLITKNEEELIEWLQLLQYHKRAAGKEEKTSRKDYEYVWKVEVLPRGLASINNLTGYHWLCCSDRTLSLVRVDNPEIKKDFMLNSVRSCSSRNAKFVLQMGGMSVFGRGELIFQTEDTVTARKIHTTIGRAMNRRRNSCVGEANRKSQINVSLKNEVRQSNSCPNERTISSSVKRKLISLATVRQTHSDGGTSPFSRHYNALRDCAVEKFPGYLDMKKFWNNEIPMKEFRNNRKITDEYYTPMNCGDKTERPTTLSLSPATEVTSLSSYPMSQFGTPLSACSGYTSLISGRSQPSSITSSEDSHSRKVPFLDGDYVPMKSPVTPVTTPHYLDMSRSSLQFAATSPTQNVFPKKDLHRVGSCSFDTTDQFKGGSAGTTGITS